MDYLVFSAPQPSLLPKYLALVYPFGIYVWILLGVSILVFSILFYAFARIEGYVLNERFSGYHYLKNASWFAFGTFLGTFISIC